MTLILLTIFGCSVRFACDRYNEAVEDCKDRGGSVELDTVDCDEATDDEVELYLCRGDALIGAGCSTDAMYECD